MYPNPNFGKRLVPGEPQHVAAVKLMFDWYGNCGYTQEQIVRAHAARGVPDRSGNPEWRKPSIRVILRNRKYTGDMTWNRAGRRQSIPTSKDGQIRTRDAKQKRRRRTGEADWIIVPDVHEPLIDRASTSRVAKRLAENRRKNDRTSGVRRPEDKRENIPVARTHPLTGLLICGECGWRMIGSTDHATAAASTTAAAITPWVVQSVITTASARTRYCPCLVRKIKEFALEPRRSLDRLRRREIQGKQADETTREGPAQLKTLKTKLAKLDQDIDKGKRNMALADDAYSIKEIGQTVREWKAEREQLVDKIDRLERGADHSEAEQLVKECEAALWRLQDVLNEGDPEEVRNVLREMVSKVELWFNHCETAKQTRNTFARGLIHLRLDFRVVGGVTPSGSSFLTEMYTGKRGTPPSDSS